MRNLRNRTFASAAIIAVASFSLIVTDDAFARGCGGGRHRNQQSQQDDQGSGMGNENHHDNDNENGGHRRNRNRNQGADDGDGHHGNADGRRPGYRPHHRWNPGDTGPDVEVGVGVGGRYGVRGGLIGPPTQACAEFQHAMSQLHRLQNLRTEINNGRKILIPNDRGGNDVVKTDRVRRENLTSASQASTAEALIANNRAASLSLIDSDIGNIEHRLDQLRAECR